MAGWFTRRRTLGGLAVLLMWLANLSPEHAQRVGGLHIAAGLARAAVSISLKRVALARCEEQVMLQALLPGVKIVVTTLQRIELLVRTPLDNLPLLHHQDLVSATDG